MSKPLTVEAVVRRVDRIYTTAGDSEGAHIDEDKLLKDVLRAIATDTSLTIEGARILANEALRVEQIEYSRWYA